MKGEEEGEEDEGDDLSHGGSQGPISSSPMACSTRFITRRGVLQAWCQVSGARSLLSGVKCQVLGVRCQLSGARCLVPGVRC